MNTTRSAWDNSRHWPVSHRSQHDAGLPDGPIDEPVTNRHRLYFGVLMGLLVIGPGLIDLWAWL